MANHPELSPVRDQQDSHFRANNSIRISYRNEVEIYSCNVPLFHLQSRGHYFCGKYPGMSSPFMTWHTSFHISLLHWHHMGGVLAPALSWNLSAPHLGQWPGLVQPSDYVTCNIQVVVNCGGGFNPGIAGLQREFCIMRGFGTLSGALPGMGIKRMRFTQTTGEAQADTWSGGLSGGEYWLSERLSSPLEPG